MKMKMMKTKHPKESQNRKEEGRDKKDIWIDLCPYGQSHPIPSSNPNLPFYLFRPVRFIILPFLPSPLFY
jgi:hypothetical protein